MTSRHPHPQTRDAGAAHTTEVAAAVALVGLIFAAITGLQLPATLAAATERGIASALATADGPEQAQHDDLDLAQVRADAESLFTMHPGLLQSVGTGRGEVLVRTQPDVSDAQLEAIRADAAAMGPVVVTRATSVIRTLPLPAPVGRPTPSPAEWPIPVPTVPPTVTP